MQALAFFLSQFVICVGIAERDDEADGLVEVTNGTDLPVVKPAENTAAHTPRGGFGGQIRRGDSDVDRAVVVTLDLCAKRGSSCDSVLQQSYRYPFGWQYSDVKFSDDYFSNLALKGNYQSKNPLKNEKTRAFRRKTKKKGDSCESPFWSE